MNPPSQGVAPLRNVALSGECPPESGTSLRVASSDLSKHCQMAEVVGPDPAPSLYPSTERLDGFALLIGASEGGGQEREMWFFFPPTGSSVVFASRDAPFSLSQFPFVCRHCDVGFRVTLRGRCPPCFCCSARCADRLRGVEVLPARRGPKPGFREAARIAEESR